MRIEYAAQAVLEVDEALAYYHAIDPALSKRLAAEIDETLRLITAMPLSWKLVAQDVRQCRVKVFPFAFIYVVKPDVIGVIALANTHRRPHYWRDRLVAS